MLRAAPEPPVLPKVNGQEICMAWAIKGRCSRSCRRVHQHTHYNRSINAKIHQIMDTCGLAPSP